MAAQWRNTLSGYGWISILIHWFSAVLILALLASGIYMVTLGYYDPLYHKLPYWHKLTGVVVVTLTLLRVIWRFTNPQPAELPAPIWQLWSARLVHLAFYVAIFSLAVSGYIMTTAEDDPIELLWGLQIPSMGTWSSETSDLCGDLHRWIAYGLAAMIVLHAGAAFYHHLWQKDATLRRMLFPVR